MKDARFGLRLDSFETALAKLEYDHKHGPSDWPVLSGAQDRAGLDYKADLLGIIDRRTTCWSYWTIG